MQRVVSVHYTVSFFNVKIIALKDEVAEMSNEDIMTAIEEGTIDIDDDHEVYLHSGDFCKPCGVVMGGSDGEAHIEITSVEGETET